jgi:hypothetical protein
METLEVNEAQFRQQLWRWKSVGRTLLNLPNIEKRDHKLRISVVSVDNITCYSLKKSFDSYQKLLTWYGSILDELE